MAQEVTITVVEISSSIENSTTFSIVEPGGSTVTPNTCTKSDLVSGLTVIVSSNTATSLIFTATSGVCNGVATETVTWTSEPPNCDFDVDVVTEEITPTPTFTPTLTPTPLPNCDFSVDTSFTTATPTPTPTFTPTPTITVTPTPNCNFDVDVTIV